MSVKINGKLLNVFKKPTVIDKETNKPKEAEYAVQLLSEIRLKNSDEIKNELIDIKIKSDSVAKYKIMIGKEVDIIVNTFSKSPIYLSEI
jgi:hypothetical protein